MKFFGMTQSTAPCSRDRVGRLPGLRGLYRTSCRENGPGLRMTSAAPRMGRAGKRPCTLLTAAKMFHQGWKSMFSGSSRHQHNRVTSREMFARTGVNSRSRPGQRCLAVSRDSGRAAAPSRWLSLYQQAVLVWAIVLCPETALDWAGLRATQGHSRAATSLGRKPVEKREPLSRRGSAAECGWGHGQNTQAGLGEPMSRRPPTTYHELLVSGTLVASRVSQRSFCALFSCL